MLFDFFLFMIFLCNKTCEKLYLCSTNFNYANIEKECYISLWTFVIGKKTLEPVPSDKY